MSERPSPTSPTEATEKAEFSGTHLLIGFVIGAVLQFGWWALFDQLSLQKRDAATSNAVLSLLLPLSQIDWPGFLIGATPGAITSPANAPLRSVAGKAIAWACEFTVAILGLGLVRLLLQAVLGQALGNIVSSVVWFGIIGLFVGLTLEWKRKPPTDAKTTSVSF